jgi:hypothetical protein
MPPLTAPQTISVSLGRAAAASPAFFPYSTTVALGGAPVFVVGPESDLLVTASSRIGFRVDRLGLRLTP